MSLDKKYINLAFNIKEEEKKKIEKSCEKQLENLRNSNKEFSDIETSLSICGSEYALFTVTGDTEKAAECEKRLTELNNRKAEILSNAKIKSASAVCPVCKDSGYVDGKLCSCITDIARSLALNDLASQTQSENCTFDNFNISLYPEDSSKRMQSIFAFAKNYAENFSYKSGNVLFMGKTGLGKTHLSLAIASTVINKGYDVVYGPAQNLFFEVETEYFSYSGIDEKLKRLLNTDLLIIDDLGTEFSTQYIQSVFYNIVNTRINSGKATIISTNLSFEEIEERYTQRIASRLIGNYDMRLFAGNDIRQVLKMKER